MPKDDTDFAYAEYAREERERREAAPVKKTVRRAGLEKLNDTATVTINWRGKKTLVFSFEAKTWAKVQRVAAETIKKSGTR